MYSINIDRAKKIFHASASGRISKEEGEAFLKELKDKASSINTADYYLIVDSRKVEVSTQDTTGVLQEVLEFYTNTPFIKKIYIVPENVITKMQNKRMDKNGFHSDVIQVATYEDALKAIES